MKLRQLFREKVSFENKGDITYQKNVKSYIKGFLDGQKIEIENNKIIIESLHGKDISGHLFALASKLNNYTNYNVFIVAKDTVRAENLLNNYSLKNIKVVKHMSYEYGFYLATSQVLINDNTFYPFFSKREGQKY